MNKMNPSMFTLPDGGRYVVIPESEYEALIDRLDIAETNAARKEGDEGYPADVMDPLIDGDNPVRVFRKWRGMTVNELAEKAGISQPYLSEIENGKKDGTVQTLVAIADALDIDLDDLAGWLVKKHD